MMATSIVNVLPSRVIQWKSPYEFLYKAKPKYDSFKVFGCKCTYKDNTPHKDKFGPRAYETVLLGFSLGQKGWKLLDLEIMKIVFSRHV